MRAQTLIAQCRFALKDDGLFLAALFAGDTLHVSEWEQQAHPLNGLACSCAASQRRPVRARLRVRLLCTTATRPQELRVSCALAQMEGQGGVSPVVSPFAQARRLPAPLVR